MPPDHSCNEPAAARATRAGVLALLLGVAGVGSAQEPVSIADAESSAPAPEASMRGTALLAALRRGGYVVYFRHTATDFSRDDARMQDLADCANQRLLSEQGRLDARAIGAALRDLGLSAAESFASPMCRTMEHARLMLGTVVPRAEIREGRGGDYAGLKRLLAAPVAAGGNRWIVGHGIPFRAVAGPPHLAEGEAAVLLPRTSGWTVIARLQVGDWPALAAAR